MTTWTRGAIALAAALTLLGCGAEVKVSTKPEKLEGETLAKRANAQLEKQNKDLASGQLTCDDVTYDVGATARCLRTVVLDDGRLVRIGATITIDDTDDGGHFQIKVDDAAKEFGITGKAVFADLAKQYADQTGSKKPTGSCPPYLAGKVGTTFDCTLVTEDGPLPVRVKVSGVDAKTYNTEYTYKAVKPAS